MSRNTAQVNFNIINQAYSISGANSGLVFAIGATLRGPDNDPKDIINSVSQFNRYFGGEQDGDEFSAECIRALQAGAALRVCRVVGSGADNSETAVLTNGTAEGLFKLVSKEKGLYTEDLQAVVSDASNGDASYFNLKIEDTETGEVENFTNLKIESKDAPYSYLKKVKDFSRLAYPVYSDISSASGTLRPSNGTYAFTGGADGATPVLADYVGVQASKTGLYAFDDYDDSYYMVAFGRNETNLEGIGAAGSAYVSLRKDLVYLQHLDNDHDTTTTMIAEKTGISSSSKFVGLISGGNKVVDTVAGGVKSVPALGELMGIIVNSNRQYGIWASPTNRIRGRFNAAVGVVNNFGSPSTIADLNTLANQGINMVINRYNTTMLWDFYSQSPDESPEKFLSVVLTQIYLKKSLKPFLEGFLTDPNIPDTWRSIYHGVKPFLDGLVGNVFQSYSWEGDQYTQSIDNLQVNNAVDVGQGKYKAILRVVMAVPMVEFTLDFIMERETSTVI